MSTETIPNLPPVDAPRLTIPAPTRVWANRAWRVVDSTAATVVALAVLIIWMTLIGAGQ